MKRGLSWIGLAWMVGLAGVAGCVGYKSNVTAAKLAASSRPAGMLEAYLSQTSADPAVCDLDRTDGRAIQAVDAGVVKALFRGVGRGSIPPERGGACLAALWRSGGTSAAPVLSKHSLGALVEVAKDRTAGPADYAWADAVLAALVARPDDQDLLGVEQAEATLAKLARTEGRDSRRGDLLQRSLAVLEVERGAYQGEPVTRARVKKTKDRRLLETWARRLPDASLRRVAGEQLLELRIAASDSTWVQANADLVRKAALRGRVELPEGSVVTGGRWTPVADGTVMLRVLQQPRRGTIRLLPAAAEASRSGDASLKLADSLWLDVDGMDQSVTLCEPRRFDPLPCLPPRQVELKHPVATLDPSGRLIFPDTLTFAELVELGRDGDRLRAQAVVEGAVIPVDVPIVYDSVPELVFLGVGGQGNGPDLQVRVAELSERRLLFEVREGQRKKRWSAVVEHDDAAFAVVSRGVRTSAELGRGGQIRVVFDCTDCEALWPAVKRMVRSRGTAPGKVVFKRKGER